jgi:hypothetical protein
MSRMDPGSLLLASLLLVAFHGCKQPDAPPPPPPVEVVQHEETPPAVEEPPATEEPPAVEEPPDDAGSTPDVVEEVADKGPKGLRRFTMSDGSETAGPVDFRHRKHQKQFGCKKCHHEIAKDQTPAPCGSCHGEQEEICDLQTSFHKTCNPCHGSMGMGPVKCLGCHRWIKKQKKGKEAG